MSLPPAPQDISEHPQAGAVTVPVDKRAQEADIDRKVRSDKKLTCTQLRFYGVIQAFREGRMPDNRQIDKTLKYVYENSPVDVNQLSPDGKKLIQDTRDIIETARIIVKEKNADELFQKFVWHTRDVSLETAKMQPGDVPQADKEKVAEDRKLAVRHLRTILSLILTNSEVRKLLSDFSVIGRDLLAKGAGKAAETLRPTQEQLAKVDEPAPPDQFVSRGGQKVGPGEVPVLGVSIPGTNVTVEQHPHDDEPKVITGEGEQKPGSQAYKEGVEEARRRYGGAAGQAGELKDQAYQNAQQKAERAREGGDVEGARAETSAEAEEKKQGFMERVRGVRVRERLTLWFSAMAEDPLNKRFGEDWARLTKDLLFDSAGSLQFKPQLWSDIRKVIVPTLVDKVGYIPIPRVEYTDDTIDLVVENLTLQGRNLFPNIVTLDAHNFMKFSPYDTISDEQHHEFEFKFAQMQADMRDVAIWYRKKTGFPKVEDSGIADVLIGGSGLTATVHLVSADKDKSSVFKVKSVHVKVDTLKFSIRDSKHDLLYKTLKPLATALVKRQIQKAIAGGIQTGFEYLDGQLVSVRDRMKEAKESSDTNRKQALQDLFKRNKKEESVKTTESKSQFKVVHTKRESIIGADTPAGWMNRVVDREEKATAGEEWRSEA
ncbi:hypothetical protein PISMIDRAFT_100825 [Pisolithus microcarpus 441]|uniref:Unplaced genomic scaffold scaffold_44, whole genome shotgun sequence n=1 Tax=Pisolithus microcarpus 441 TaxID=765257 RepID=A0A0C9ZBC4_9AGAM|nr:hypothetical protein PISMIDRAFT_100825 [Pisolithus microcarpus 441]